MKNIYLLPTDKPSRLHFWTVGKGPKLELCELEYSHTRNTQHIYITSDEEIDYENWACHKNITKDKYQIVKCNVSNKESIQEHWKKIILTTDPELLNDGVQAIDDEFLEWFVKNPSCEYVEIKMQNYYASGALQPNLWEYKIIIPQEELKTGYVKSETEFLGVEFTLKDGSKQFIPKQETNMSNITANKLIKDWKKTLKSEWIQLDNLDEAKLVFDKEGNVIVENEHGTQFPVSDLSDVELDIFYTNLI
jgi:hypothetical protein